MNEQYTNFEKAKFEADKIDTSIIDTLQSGRSFRVEAGAGSGKTYSLNKVIQWIQSNKLTEFTLKRQNVICITYTNAAVDVIRNRLPNDSFILPSTIHSFAWNAIKQYQHYLINKIKSTHEYSADESDFSKVKEVRYTLGHRYTENGVHYLFHDDVLKLFCELLDNAKFRHIFAKNYPLILIDEYQDSYKPFIESCIKYFIETNKGPQFGFFGDAWQTIYQSNNACGLIEHKNIVVINKKSNFRSSPKIVEFLNKLRPNLPQISAIDDFDGEICVITCEDYSGQRRKDRNYKGELPEIEMKERIENVIKKIKLHTNNESLKVMMITHKVLATQQGYDKLLEILKDGLRDKEDPFFKFFMNTVEPIHSALTTSNMKLLFDTLGVQRFPIKKKSEKNEWKKLQLALTTARSQRAIDVYNVIVKSKLVPIPPTLLGWMELYSNAPETIYAGNTSIKEFLDLDYEQFISAIKFMSSDAFFSTEHGVKGEEYDNVLFVISKGWSLYQFEKYVPMITGIEKIPVGKENSFERNRNLFYVCCSRPKKRLYFFVSIPIEFSFNEFLKNNIGENNIYAYDRFIKE